MCRGKERKIQRILRYRENVREKWENEKERWEKEIMCAVASGWY